jgi:hypothetical protein|tara:strand:- start:2787 stop:3026 length:240 start_codon:yes stop_codon:yes gene_type:complete
MFDDTNLEEDLRAQVLSLMYVLYEFGLEEVHMGGLMRVLGVPDHAAEEWDDKVMCLDAAFAKYMSEMQTLIDAPGQTLH